MANDSINPLTAVLSAFIRRYPVAQLLLGSLFTTEAGQQWHHRGRIVPTRPWTDEESSGQSDRTTETEDRGPPLGCLCLHDRRVRSLRQWRKQTGRIAGILWWSFVGSRSGRRANGGRRLCAVCHLAARRGDETDAVETRLTR